MRDDVDVQAGVVDGVAAVSPSRLRGRERIRPAAGTLVAIAVVFIAPRWMPGPWDGALIWVAYIGSALLLWTRGPRVDVDRRSALLVLGLPFFGGIMAVTALWRAFSPRRYWRPYPGWGQRGWTVAIAFSAIFFAVGVWDAVHDQGWRAASFEEVALAGFEEGSDYANEQVAKAEILTTIDISQRRRLAVVRVQTTGGLVAPEAVNLVRRGGVLGTAWERDHSFDRYDVTCAKDRYCLDVFGRDAVTARIEPEVPELAARLEGVPTDLPVRNGVVFVRNLTQVRALFSGAEIVAYDAAGNEVPRLRGRLGAYELSGDPKPPPAIVVED